MSENKDKASSRPHRHASGKVNSLTCRSTSETMGKLVVCQCDSGVKYLSVYYQNVRGLRTKLDLILHETEFSNYEVLVFSETGLNDTFLDKELNLHNFTIYRKDRSSQTSGFSRLGGVLIAVKSCIYSELVHTPDVIEQVCVIVGRGSSKLLIGAVYLPPESDCEKYNIYCSTLEEICELYPRSQIHLFGDFNLPNTTWQNEELGCIASTQRGAGVGEREAAMLLSDTCSFLNLFQCSMVFNYRHVMLDLVFSTASATEVVEVVPLLPLDRHHPALRTVLPFRESNTEDPLLVADGWYRDFRNADYDSINTHLSWINWDILLEGQDLDEMIRAFYNQIYYTVHLFVPQRRFKQSTYPPWYTMELKNLIKSKKEAHATYKSSSLGDDYRIFSNLRSQCRVLSRRCYSAYIRKIESNIPHNLKSFWNFINSKRNDHGIPDTMYLDKVKFQSGQDIVDRFADYFSHVYVDSNSPESISLNGANVNNSNFSISISSIFEKFRKLDTNKGPGPDGVPAVMLKKCSFVLSRPLWYIFNKSLDTGSLPDLWKLSYVSPIFKSGDKHDIKHYRPISLLSTIPKVFESIVNDSLSLLVRDVIIDEQHGFCCGRSTETNLTVFTQFLSEALESRCQVDTIYTDFSKAFDRVNHNILLSKLKLLSIPDKVLKWLRSYLTGRYQIVKLKNYISYPIRVTSGVPQGSHLGPLLFNLFINDIKSNFSCCKFLLFADDLKVFHRISSPDDALQLQHEINNLSLWCLANGMELNVNKCLIMRFYKIKTPIIFNYKLNDILLETKLLHTDLGIAFDEELTFHAHIDKIINKSFKMLGFIKRYTSDFKNPYTVKYLYVTLVRPHLEYCTVVWSPYYNIHINRIERVQKKFLRYLAFRMHFEVVDHDYTYLMRSFKISLLNSRRIVNDLKFLFKLLNSIICCPELLSRVNTHVPARTTRQIILFSIPQVRTNYGMNSPMVRILKLANQNSTNLKFWDCTLSSFIRQAMVP